MTLVAVGVKLRPGEFWARVRRSGAPNRKRHVWAEVRGRVRLLCPLLNRPAASEANGLRSSTDWGNGCAYCLEMLRERAAEPTGITSVQVDAAWQPKAYSEIPA